MRRLPLLGFSLLLAAAPLLAQSSVQVANPNILYPGSPSGGQPGSILTPGSPRTPASIPATPGAAAQPKPRPQGPRGRRNRGGYPPVYGYGYGGVYMDSGNGPTEVAPPEEEESANTNVIRVPSREKKDPPHSRVYDVTETADGGVEMTSIRNTGGTPVDYSLIALQGGLIYAVEKYWRQQETFRFLTVNGKEFIVPPAELDIEFTKKLNADLGKEFVAP